MSTVGELTPQDTPRDFHAGDRLGVYLIEKLIGVGGMADVYLARHAKLDKEVAIKVLNRHARERSDLRGRFLREGQAASRIRNRHVVEIFDVSSAGDIPYLVMQYLPGPTLEEHLAEHGAFEIEEAVHIFLPIAAAIAAGHEQGVVHRDLKPDNVILAVEGHRRRPTVLDFGVSRLVTSDPRLTLDSSVIGTPHYMSPEQARGEPIDSKTDQYALGVMFYQTLTGKLPRDRTTVLELLHEVGHEGFDPPSVHRAGLPPSLEAVVLKAMAPTRQERFETMHDFMAALLPFASPSAQSYWAEELGIRPTTLTPFEVPAVSRPRLRAAPPAPSTSIPPARRRRDSSHPTLAPEPRARWPLALAAVLLLGVAAAGGFYAWTLAGPGAPAAPESYTVAVDVHPEGAIVELDGVVWGGGRIEQRFARDGSTHALRVRAEGYEPMTLTFRDAPPPSEVTLSPLPTPAEPAPGEVEAAQAAAGDAPSDEVGAARSAVAADAETEAETEADTEADTGADTGTDSEAEAAERPRASAARGRVARPRGAPARSEPAGEPAPAAEPTPAAATPDPEPRGSDWTPSRRSDNLDPWTR